MTLFQTNKTLGKADLLVDVLCSGLGTLRRYPNLKNTSEYLQLNSEQHQTDGFFAAVLQRNAS